MKRLPADAHEPWQQLEFRLTFPEQRVYELIRPVVLYGQSLTERAEETGTSRRTIQRYLAHFRRHGLRDGVGATPLLPTHRLPPAIRDLILDLKAEHPPLRVNQLATICYARTGRRPDDKTITRVLATHDLPPHPRRRFPHYHQMTNPAERRATILRLHVEGWGKKAISAYLGCHRDTVHATLHRWVTDGLAGLYNQSRAPHRRIRKVNLSTIATVRRFQRNPRLGEFRMHAKLKQMGIHLSPRTCSRIMALNRQLYTQLREQPLDTAIRPMPFAATYRHQYWSVDIRHLTAKEQQVTGVAYSITLLDNYSRAILASALSRTQDLTAYLVVFFAALTAYGAPDGLVSDGAAVFQAHQAQTIYDTLGITHHQIEPRRAWQNYVETTFNVQRRMADWHFMQATTWDALVHVHAQWTVDFNYQPHWAHRQREDQRHSPVDVLAWVHGRSIDMVTVQRLFQTTRFTRVFDASGYIRFRRWKLYGEYGLAGQHAVLWLTAETLAITFDDQNLVAYTVQHNQEQQLTTVSDPHVHATTFRSPQLPLWEGAAGYWRSIIPPRDHEPLYLWEYDADGILKVIPHEPPPRSQPLLPFVVQEALALEG